MFQAHGFLCTAAEQEATVRHLISQVHSRGVLPAATARELVSKVGPTDFIYLAEGILFVREAKESVKKDGRKNMFDVADMFAAGRQLTKAAFSICEGKPGDAMESFNEAAKILDFYKGHRIVSLAIQSLSNLSPKIKGPTPKL